MALQFGDRFVVARVGRLAAPLLKRAVVLDEVVVVVVARARLDRLALQDADVLFVGF